MHRKKNAHHLCARRAISFLRSARRATRRATRFLEKCTARAHNRFIKFFVEKENVRLKRKERSLQNQRSKLKDRRKHHCKTSKEISYLVNFIESLLLSFVISSSSSFIRYFSSIPPNPTFWRTPFSFGIMFITSSIPAI